MQTTLLLIRHGETDYVAKGIMSARMSGVPLNQKGREQASAVAQALASAPISHIYSSPMQRALETASFLSDLLMLPVVQEEGIIETDVGEWTGLRGEQVKDSVLWQVLHSQPSRMQFPGGESFVGIQERMVAALKSIASQHPGEMVACFSHSDPLRLALAHFLDIPLDSFQRLSIDTCSISILTFAPDGQARVRRINQVAGSIWA